MAEKGGGQGRVRCQFGKGRIVRCTKKGHELCQRAAFYGRGVEGEYHCAGEPLVPKTGRLGQQKQAKR